MKKRIVILIVLLALGGAGFYAYNGLHRQPDDRILISGNIELTEVNIAFKTSGRLIERGADEGDTVKKGQVVARLDRDQLTAQRDSQAASLQSAQSQLDQSETSLAYQRATTAADIEQRKADVDSNTARLAELQNGSRPQEKQDAKAAVDAAQSAADRSQADWERAQTLFKNDDISRAQYDQFRSAWESATANLRSAKEKQALVDAGPRAEVIQAQIGQLERARAALKMSEANSLEIKRREQELTSRRADIERARANLALIDSQLADTTAVSPVDGVVLVKSAEVGEVLAPGTAVLTIGDYEHPWLRGYINETDQPRVKIGAKARVTTDQPGKVYWGRVSFISSEAEFTPKQIQTQQERVKLVYRIKIDLDNPRQELKQNMPVDAEIVLQ
ncbi:MAG TPA: HlyD family efflux transporter periplasmic adaptor subunit [Verrucomicrobiae bacterium]|nr:HlyD family efflux transporter periplasmic adaptor subunit [Verrucomicrobiae bacterium]